MTCLAARSFTALPVLTLIVAGALMMRAMPR